jgi:hypothetical protein
MIGFSFKIFVLLLVACAAFSAQAEEPQAEAKEPEVQAREPFERPVLLTSAGQSVDIKLAGVLMKRLKIEHESNPKAMPADLEGFKTLIVVPGYSSKGLGSAGISREEEMKRVEALLEQAEKAKIRVLALHLGGKARRGVQSDDFNAKVVKAADLAIVVAQGDEDGFFSKICKEAEIPIEIVGVIADAMKPLETAIKPLEGAISEK